MLCKRYALCVLHAWWIWIKNNIGKIVDDPDDIIEGLATGDTVKELFRVNVSNDNGLVNVTTSVKSLK